MRTKSDECMQRILEYTNTFFATNHRFPTKQQIADELGIAKSTACRYLQAMDSRGMISYDGKNILTELSKRTDTDYASGPLLGSVSCGIPLLEEENIEKYVSLPVSIFGKGKLFILKANGDSMNLAGIDDGDLVVVRQQSEARPGQIIVALLDDGSNTLKRLTYSQDGTYAILRPESTNPANKEIPVKSLRIQGVAINVIKTLSEL